MGSAPDLLRFRVADAIDIESGAGGATPALARSFPKQRNSNLVSLAASTQSQSPDEPHVKLITSIRQLPHPCVCCLHVGYMSPNIGSCFQVSEVLASANPMVLYALAAIAGLAMLFLAAHTSPALVAVLLTCLLMLAFAVFLAQWVMAKDEGTVDMQEVCSWRFPHPLL